MSNTLLLVIKISQTNVDQVDRYSSKAFVVHFSTINEFVAHLRRRIYYSSEHNVVKWRLCVTGPTEAPMSRPLRTLRPPR